MMFKPGDIVRYKSKPTGQNYNTLKAGLIGEVISKIQNDERFGHYWSVKMHNDQRYFSNRECPCYGVNLEHIEFKYDPTQAGDTDEDV